MGLVSTPAYDLENSQLQKEPIIACVIEGSPYIFSTNFLYTRLRYDDPGVLYDGTYQYDGLRPVDRSLNLPIIDRQGSVSTISQKLEQWDGKASIETFNLKFIDYQQLITKICSPGALLDEILNKKITIFFGYKTLSYPDDYLVLFKGYVNQYQITQGSVILNLTDPSSLRKQDIFNASISQFTAAAGPTDSILSISSTENLYQTILDAKGNNDDTVTVGMILNSNEIVTYTNDSFISTGLVHDGSFSIGQLYSIIVPGTTTWSAVGVPFGTIIEPGVTFIATASSGGGTGEAMPLVADGSFTIGQTYAIYQLGTTDWLSIGVPSGTTIGPGTIFTATSTGSGGTGNATAGVADGSFIVGVTYQITFVGTTDWVSAGAPTGFVVGTTFVATTAGGSGTGLAIVIGQIQVNRAQFGTVASSYNSGDSIDMFINFQDNPISIALKLMLSGWNGPCFTDLALRGIVNTDGNGILLNSITFGIGVDMIRDYGLNLGDFLILSGSPNSANNAVFTVADFADDNRTVLVEEKGILIQENPSGSGNLSTVVAIRSRYDTYPILAGLQLTTDDVFVSRHEYVRDTFIQTDFNLSEKGNESSAKTYIETHLFKPVGAYSLTQGARISVGATHPPLSEDLTKTIDETNVVNPDKIVVTRGLNTRFFYNAIQFNYAYDVVNDNFLRELEIDDSDSQNRLNQTSVLQIDCRGFPDSPDSVRQMTARAERLLLRYKYGAETIELDTFFGVGHQIDSGDTIVLNDAVPSVLQISNTDVGSRGVYNRVMEVQERTIKVTEGATSLTLLSNNGFNVTDRYGVISGSSQIDGTMPLSTTSFWIRDSYGPKFPGAEYKKWQDYQGYNIIVHNNNWTVSAIAAFTLDANNPYLIHVTPALPFTPADGYIMEFEPYDDSSAKINPLAKSQFCAFDSSAPIASASSSTVFVLQTGFASRYAIGMAVYVNSPDVTRFSPDVKITNIVGDVITIGPILNGGVNNDLGFIPQAGDLLQLGGFLDGGAGYRLI